MPAPAQTFAPGAYKFTVQSAAEAVRLILEKLGPQARVLSVRPVPASGLRKFLVGPQLEVIAQVDAVPPPPPALAVVSAEPATPTTPPERPAPSRLAGT